MHNTIKTSITIQQTKEVMKRGAKYLKACAKEVDYQRFLHDIIDEMNPDKNSKINAAKEGIKLYAKMLKETSVDYKGCLFKLMNEIGTEEDEKHIDDNNEEHKQRITLLTKSDVTEKCSVGHCINSDQIHFGNSKCIRCAKPREIEIKQQPTSVEIKSFLQKYKNSSNISGPKQSQQKEIKQITAAFNEHETKYPLHAAAMNGDIDTIRELCESKQMDPNEKCTEEKYGKHSTPMQFAARFGQLSVVIELILLSAQYDGYFRTDVAFPHPDNNGYTPYSKAVYYKQHSVVTFLQKYAKFMCGVDVKDQMRECVSCWLYDKKYAGYNQDNTMSRYAYCRKCQGENTNEIKERQRYNQSTQIEVHKTLQQNPSISIDALCGMKDKRGLDQLLRDITVSTNPNRYHLYLIDLDNFKTINTCLTHHGADQILVKVGNVLKEFEKQPELEQHWKHRGVNIRRIWAFHQGGDEYAIIVEGGYKEEDIRDQQKFYVELHNAINNIKLPKECVDKHGNVMKNVGITVGVYCGWTTSYDEWLKKADEVANDVKRNGKNGLRVYDGWTCKKYADFTTFRKKALK